MLKTENEIIIKDDVSRPKETKDLHPTSGSCICDHEANVMLMYHPPRIRLPGG